MLSREQLDEIECSTPGCQAPDHPEAPELEIDPLCHRGEPLDLSYTKADGVLRVACHVCKEELMQILVASHLPGA